MNDTSPLSHLTLAPGREGPLYRQIYQRMRDAVLSGELRAGARLPSARSLASQLAVARGTVETAYQLLAGEGYIVGRGAAGTFAERVPTAAPPAVTGAPSVVGTQRAEGRNAGTLLHMGMPALDAFPRKLWASLTARCARALVSGDLAYQDPAGRAALRRTIAGYLRVARGVACAPEQVFVAAGYQGALALVSHALLRPGDDVWVEDPGYLFGREALALAGANLVAVPVDNGGLDVAAGTAAAPRARFAVVTPCHQFPFGATLPASRRLALLDWAAASGAWIIEDDYDSEYRYRGRPLPALKSMDARQRVLYAGTFSKVIFPALRMGYLVVPEALIPRFRATAAALHPAPSALMQSVVAAFIESGHFARHIRRMRQLYGERRRALAEALGAALAGRLAVEAPAGGMHLILRLPPGADDIAAVARAHERNLWPSPLSTCGVAGAAAPGLLIGFTNVPAAEARAVAAALAATLFSEPI